MFLYLLLHSGYLTMEKLDSEKEISLNVPNNEAVNKIGSNKGRQRLINLKIPNNEVREYFFEIVLENLIKRIFIKNLELDEVVSCFVGSIEKKDEYVLNIQQNFLDKMNPGDKKEADFQALLGGIAQFASLSGVEAATHEPFCESYTGDSKKIDTIFFPVDETKSKIIIIHEYKILKAKTQNTLEKRFENAFWQVYMNNYIGQALARNNSCNNYFTQIIVRVLIFQQNIQNI